MTTIKPTSQTAIASDLTTEATTKTTDTSPAKETPVATTPELPPLKSIIPTLTKPTTMAESLSAAVRDGFTGIDARTKQIQSIMMRAMMTQEGSLRLQAELDVLAAAKGGESAIDQALAAHQKLMMSARFDQVGGKIAGEKLDALQAAKAAFSVVSGESKHLQSIMMRAMMTPEGYRSFSARIAAFDAFAGGAAKIDEALDFLLTNELARTPESEKLDALKQAALEAVKGGAKGIADELKSITKLRMVAMMTPEMSKALDEKTAVLEAMGKVFSKIGAPASEAAE